MKGRMTGPSTGVFRCETGTQRPSTDNLPYGDDRDMSYYDGMKKKKHNPVSSRDHGMDY